tara:strand:+ start:60 stop:383 length:324 start_codon:yes stop_codon:yes gene_type:complete
MAKKKTNRSSEVDVEDDAPQGFAVSKTKVGKQKLVTVTFQLSELHEAHLDTVASDSETTRAEFCKQAVDYCLRTMDMPFPETVTEEMQQILEARREKRADWAASRGK